MAADPRNGSPPDGAKPEDDSWRDLENGPARPAAKEGSSALALGRLEELRALVVAADPARRAALARALSGMRLGVESAAPDEAGYRKAIGFLPDAVVCELTRPGEPGWWLLQRLRRHPLLRWTPVLLMRWWRDGKDGASDVLVARVVENLAEAMTPQRVLAERIAAGRPLGERLEATGPLPLLKLLCGAGVAGTLTLNDGWNLFEIAIGGGRPAAASRRGMSGDEDVGEEALFEAALCDAGRWSFRAGDTPPPAPNLDGPLAQLALRVGSRVALVFGPDSAFRPGAAPPLIVHPERIRDLASTSAGLAHQLCETIAGGASPEELDALLREGEDRLVVERTVVALLRCGAIVPLAAGAQARLPAEEAARAARSATHVLAWLAAEHRPGGAAAGRPAKPATSTGYYQISQPGEEHIALGAAEGIVAPGAWRPSMTADLEPDYYRAQLADERPAFADTPLTSPRDDSSSGRRLGGGPNDGEHRGAPLLHDSLVPAPQEGEQRGRRARWIAVGLALLLGALLAGGLWALSTLDAGEPRPAPADGRR